MHVAKKVRVAKNSGFTLIELLVVMAIIGILAVIAIGSFTSSQIKARDASRKNDLEQIGRALEIYYSDKDEYPDHSVDFEIIGCDVKPAICKWGAQWSDGSTTIYMAELPMDPTPGLFYHYLSDGVSYQLYARLGNDQDQSIPTDSGDPANYSIDCGSCGDSSCDCNYGVSSSNKTVGDGRTIVPD